MSFGTSLYLLCGTNVGWSMLLLWRDIETAAKPVVYDGGNIFTALERPLLKCFTRTLTLLHMQLLTLQYDVSVILLWQSYLIPLPVVVYVSLNIDARPSRLSYGFLVLQSAAIYRELLSFVTCQRCRLCQSATKLYKMSSWFRAVLLGLISMQINKLTSFVTTYYCRFRSRTNERNKVISLRWSTAASNFYWSCVQYLIDDYVFNGGIRVPSHFHFNCYARACPSGHCS